MRDQTVTIVGGGLAGVEAAWQCAQRGHRVRLYEMRPVRSTEAHITDRLAELVCSNSMGSILPDRALGILKNEMRAMGSLVIETAFRHALPAGGALAVGRDEFAEDITNTMSNHPRIELIREELTEIPTGPTILATGPLTSPALTEQIQQLADQKHLYFYDAMAPIVHAESIDMSIAFRQSRYDRDSDLTTNNESSSEPGSEPPDKGDYINCPFDQSEYEAFVNRLLEAPRIPLNTADKEMERYFEGCMPIEVLASRGIQSLAFGPMRPVGLTDPRIGRRPHAVVQLRQDNVAGTLYNMVGFQTNIRWGAQKEVLQMIPGLKEAEFIRLGQMHRNTFINSPTLLRQTLQFRDRDDLFFAGQITGTEGYVGSTMGGLLAGINMVNLLQNEPLLTLPQTSIRKKLDRYAAYAERARVDQESYLRDMGFWAV